MLCICVYTYKLIYVYTFIRTYVNTYIRIYVYTYLNRKQGYIHIYIYIYILCPVSCILCPLAQKKFLHPKKNSKNYSLVTNRATEV